MQPADQLIGRERGQRDDAGRPHPEGLGDQLRLRGLDEAEQVVDQAEEQAAERAGR
ncbi:hypothetical protein [Frankia gtarii]|uniref:hypothetical protein n=1 Tax=Frankia gtarii TaxID=2950102 RepID=UPI0021C11659|nr:hypothetical protein [Frankia gtarii]